MFGVKGILFTVQQLLLELHAYIINIMNGLLLKPHTGRKETLKYSKGCRTVDPRSSKGTTTEAVEFLDAQNNALSKERMIELTYGEKKPQVQRFLPEYVKLDNQVLCFEGFVRDKVQDWWTEKNRIHFVKVLYYLENDTMKVIEPKVHNSGLYQGTMFQRDCYMHPSTVRNYHWKDLNIGNDVHLFGRTIHLYDCDTWTREFLTEQGIEVNDPEPKPENPILLERQLMEGRQEWKNVPMHEMYPSSKFYGYDGKVLQFYGIFKADSETPMGIRRIVLNFYPSDGTLEVMENWKPNSGRGPMMPHGREVFDNIPCNIGLGCWMTIIKRQRMLLDREKEIEKLPCYLEPTDDDDLTWITPEHLKTGEDIKILGKIFFLNKCNDFTQQFYKDHYGIDMPQFEVIPKPKLSMPTLVPPHEIGPWDESLQDCFKPIAILGPKVNKIPLKPKDVVETVLRFSAVLDTTRETEQDRVFIISYFMEDDTVKIHEERVRNSGHLGGTYLGRRRLRKDLGKIPELTPSLAKGAKPIYYGPSDFYIGAKIRVGGSAVFLIKDADLAVFQFMENHPEIFPDIDPKEQRELADFLKGFVKPSHNERMLLLQELKDQVLRNYGSSIFPYPKTLNLRSHYQPRRVIEEELYCANLPISKVSLKKLLDAFTVKEKTDVDEVKTILTVALGHDHSH